MLPLIGGGAGERPGKPGNAAGKLNCRSGTALLGRPGTQRQPEALGDGLPAQYFAAYSNPALRSPLTI
jgi:hypothetical protein